MIPEEIDSASRRYQFFTAEVPVLSLFNNISAGLPHSFFADPDLAVFLNVHPDPAA